MYQEDLNLCKRKHMDIGLSRRLILYTFRIVLLLVIFRLVLVDTLVPLRLCPQQEEFMSKTGRDAGMAMAGAHSSGEVRLGDKGFALGPQLQASTMLSSRIRISFSCPSRRENFMSSEARSGGRSLQPDNEPSARRTPSHVNENRSSKTIQEAKG
jgi:hypothetical protein